MPASTVHTSNCLQKWLYFQIDLITILFYLIPQNVGFLCEMSLMTISDHIEQQYNVHINIFFNWSHKIVGIATYVKVVCTSVSHSTSKASQPCDLTIFQYTWLLFCLFFSQASQYSALSNKVPFCIQHAFFLMMLYDTELYVLDFFLSQVSLRVKLCLIGYI